MLPGADDLEEAFGPFGPCEGLSPKPRHVRESNRCPCPPASTRQFARDRYDTRRNVSAQKPVAAGRLSSASDQQTLQMATGEEIRVQLSSLNGEPPKHLGPIILE